MQQDGEGSFHPRPFERGDPCPTISIGRPYYEEFDRPTRDRNASGRKVLPPPDLLRETVTLAHECGHFLSWKDRTPRKEWDAYFIAAKAQDEAWSSVPDHESVNEYNNMLRAAAQAALTKEQMQRIVAEEERAWTIARELLEISRVRCPSSLSSSCSSRFISRSAVASSTPLLSSIRRRSSSVEYKPIRKKESR